MNLLENMQIHILCQSNNFLGIRLNSFVYVNAEFIPNVKLHMIFKTPQGILALMRQWKTILHMPVEASFKKKKATFVTFQLPEEESEHGDEGKCRDI